MLLTNGIHQISYNKEFFSSKKREVKTEFSYDITEFFPVKNDIKMGKKKQKLQCPNFTKKPQRKVKTKNKIINYKIRKV